MPSRHVPVSALRDLSCRIFGACGLSGADAALVTDVLLHADIRGHGSHGVMRIPIYVERLRRGIVNPAPKLRIERPAPAFLRLDADNGPGPVGSVAAIDAAMEIARELGVCAAVVAHSNHNGPGSYYVERAAASGCIAIAMTNAPPAMAVHGGRQAAIGTNPIAFGTPAEGSGPFLADMATAVVSKGKIIDRANRGEAIPEDWALDASGRPTTSAVEANRGVILPMSGPKGSALAIMVEALTGVLGGGRFAGELGNLYTDFERSQDIAHFFLVLAVERTHPPGEVAGRMGSLVAELKDGPPAAGFDAIRMPGERDRDRAEAAARSGLAIAANILADLDRTASSLGLTPLDPSLAAME